VLRGQAGGGIEISYCFVKPDEFIYIPSEISIVQVGTFLNARVYVVDELELPRDDDQRGA
jgi:hypothetical protein